MLHVNKSGKLIDTNEAPMHNYAPGGVVTGNGCGEFIIPRGGFNCRHEITPIQRIHVGMIRLNRATIDACEAMRAVIKSINGDKSPAKGSSKLQERRSAIRRVCSRAKGRAARGGKL